MHKNDLSKLLISLTLRTASTFILICLFLNLKAHAKNYCACTNPIACNYDINATCDDGSCILPDIDSILNLSELNGNNGFIINGIDRRDFSGRTLNHAGDINGDGISDIIIGAYQAHQNGNLYAGECYVLFGDSNGFNASMNLNDLNGVNGFVIKGINTNDFTASSVSSAGDVNNDGIDDIIIGAIGGDPNGNIGAGKSYVVFGKASPFANTLNLSDLNGSNGFVLNGIDAMDNSGVSVSRAGDINGDGMTDIIIGAASIDVNGNEGAGESYVVFGKSTPFNAALNLSDLNGNNGFTIYGLEADDQLGHSVSHAGDINDDGIDDVIIGAPHADLNGLGRRGKVYVVFGKTSPFADSLNVGDLTGTNGFELIGNTQYANAGRVVSYAGDINGDSIDDVIMNGGGKCFIVFGKSSPFSASSNLEDLDGSNGFSIDIGPTSLSYAGDVNDDLIDDVIISLTASGGESYVIYGKSSAYEATLDLNDLNGITGFVARGINSNESSGSAVSYAGDINSDGISDIIIGAPTAPANGISGTGRTYVVFGKVNNVVSGCTNPNACNFDENATCDDGSCLVPNGCTNPLATNYNQNASCDDGSCTFLSVFDSTFYLSDLNGSNGFVINGIDGNDLSGRSLSNAGDINGDGIDDVVIGAFTADPNGKSNAGESYVIFGQSNSFPVSLNLSDLNGSNGFTIYGIDGNDFSGISVSHAGDINGDGIDDLIIGANGADPNGIDSAGEGYVLFGKTSPFAATINLGDLDGNNGFVINGISQGDNSAQAVSKAGDINGDGIADLLVSGHRAYPNGVVKAGKSYVVFGKTSPFAAALNLSDLDGNNGFSINGMDEVNYAGISLSHAGDFNGDGVDDIIIGAVYAAANSVYESGESYIVFGKTSAFSANLDLIDLNGSNGIVLHGISRQDWSGQTVSHAGDVNGDGIDDVIIGALQADPNGNEKAGESYVVFGQSTPFPSFLNLSDLNGNNGFIVTGINAEDFSGYAVSSAGDVNADGVDDVIIGATGADPDGKSKAGECYVVYGKTAAFADTLSVVDLDGSNGFVIKGLDIDDQLGAAVSYAGDVNADGVDDIIISAIAADPNGASQSGESYIIFGRTQCLVSGCTNPIACNYDVNATCDDGSCTYSSDVESIFNLSDLNGVNGFTINGINQSDLLGSSVSNAGDLNGDGVDDIIIGAFTADPNGNDRAGESYVVFGNTSPFESSLNLSDLNGVNGFTINGIDPVDYSGGSVSYAGDVNGDGFDDIIISASGGDTNGNENSGESYVVFGKTTAFDAFINLGDLDGSNGFVINGIDESDNSGYSVSYAGDINHDGIADLLISAHAADPNGIDRAGESYVVFGKSSSFNASLDLSNLNGSNGFVINGINAIDFSGSSLSYAGDINDDGIDDIIIGAVYADPNGYTDAGESYVVFGKAAPFSSSLNLIDLNGSNGFVIKGINAEDWSGRVVSHAGDINGDDIDDIIIGAVFGDPNGQTNAGESYIIYGKSTAFSSSINLADLDGNNGFVIKGINTEDYSGIDISHAGDINKDGIDDIIIGASKADPDGLSNAGESYVVYGQNSGFDATLDLADLNGSNGFVIIGIDQDDQSGSAVSYAGDINGDGIDDVIVCAAVADPNGNTDAGECYIVFGWVPNNCSCPTVLQFDNSNPIIGNAHASDKIIITDGINVPDMSYNGHVNLKAGVAIFLENATINPNGGTITLAIETCR